MTITKSNRFYVPLAEELLSRDLPRFRQRPPAPLELKATPEIQSLLSSGVAIEVSDIDDDTQWPRADMVRHNWEHDGRT